MDLDRATARLALHEMDHLEGTLYIDRLPTGTQVVSLSTTTGSAILLGATRIELDALVLSAGLVATKRHQRFLLPHGPSTDPARTKRKSKPTIRAEASWSLFGRGHLLP
jgi:Polypeptide deformylase